MRNKLDQREIRARMEENPSWDYSFEFISKTYTFPNFVKAIEFVNKVAEIAEKMDHHPDINIFGWNKVKIILTTHSEMGLTQMDFDLSSEIDKIFNNLNN